MQSPTYKQSMIAFVALLSFSTQPTALAFSADPLVSAWLPAWAGQNAVNSFSNNIDTFDEINLFWYALADDGSLTTDPEAENTFVLNTARANGVKTYMTVRNGFIGQRFHDIAIDIPKRDQHINDLLAKLDTMSYDGIDIDYEGLYEEDRDAFTEFVTILADKVHQRNKLLSIAVQAKTSNPGEWASLRAQDWSAIGKVVDRVRIMTYDKHYTGSGPGAVSPLPWLLEVARFAETQIDPRKIQMGLPFYGYNWSEGPDNNVSVTWQQAQSLSEREGVPVAYDDVNKSPYFAYQREEGEPPQFHWRHVWYEDARSIQDKINALHDLEVGGVAIWRLGDEDPGNFGSLNTVRNNQNSERFIDVFDGSLAAVAIEDLHRRGIVSGQNNMFNPNRNITRAETLKIALGHLRFYPTAFDPLASDVSLSDWAAPYIATGKQRGIISGYVDNSFRPNNIITRAEALKIVSRARNLPQDGNSSLPSDVPADAWYADLLRGAMDRGIVRGDENGNFRPDDPITRSELVAILTRI